MRRTGVNGNYAIGFEARLPTAWNGRFLYQGNGGADGSVVSAVGPDAGSGSTNSGLGMAFAVISPHPKSAHYKGSGRFESADSFVCQ